MIKLWGRDIREPEQRSQSRQLKVSVLLLLRLPVYWSDATTATATTPSPPLLLAYCLEIDIYV